MFFVEETSVCCYAHVTAWDRASHVQPAAYMRYLRMLNQQCSLATCATFLNIEATISIHLYKKHSYVHSSVTAITVVWPKLPWLKVIGLKLSTTMRSWWLRP